MVKIIRQGVYYMEDRLIKESHAFMTSDKKEKAIKNTITYPILEAHNSGEGENLALRFDVVASWEIRYKNILRTADASGITTVPFKYVLFARNWGDYEFSLSAAKKFGAELLPGGIAYAEYYLREQVAKSGQLLLDAGESFLCGTLGALGLTDNEGAVLRQMMGQPYEVSRPATIAVYLKGKLRKGVGPTDVGLAILKALSAAGNFADDKILEFFGPGLANLSMDYRNDVDEKMCETHCFSTIWASDDKTKEYYENHERGEDFKPLSPVQPAYYDGGITVDLSRIEPMIAIWPGIFTVREFVEHPAEMIENAETLLKKRTKDDWSFKEGIRDGKVFVSMSTIESASYETIAEVAEILRGKQIGNEISFGEIMPASLSIDKALSDNGYRGVLLSAGVNVNDFVWTNLGCDVTDGGEICDGTAILDARTIAATAANGGYLTSALDLDYNRRFKKYKFDGSCYRSRVYYGAGKPQDIPLAYSKEVPPIPELVPLPENLLLQIKTAETPDDWKNCDEPVKASEGFAEGAARASAVAFTKSTEDAEWGQAIAMREEGCIAVIGKTFTPKFRTHLIDWGILPLTADKVDFKDGSLIRLEDIRGAVSRGDERIVAKVFTGKKTRDVVFTLGTLTTNERETLLAGSRIAIIKGQKA